MCSRFCIDQEMWKELKQLFGELDGLFSGWKWNRSGQDIRPTEQSLVIAAGADGTLCPKLQRWGPAGCYHKSTVINARAETALGEAHVPGQRGFPQAGGARRQIL